MIRPSLDQANQHGPISLLSGLFRILMMLGMSPFGVLGMLQTLRLPSAVCVASMSDFCLVAEPCQARPVTREGALDVFSECTMVKGCKVAMRIDPFRYLHCVRTINKGPPYSHVPYRKCTVIRHGCNRRDRVVDSSC